jgi:hypothetical protein
LPDSVVVELNPGFGAEMSVVTPGTLIAGRWRIELAGAAGTDAFGVSTWLRSLDRQAVGACFEANPAAIVRMEIDAEPVSLGALAEFGPGCPTVVGGDIGAGVGLPHTGLGPGAERVEPLLTLAAMLAGILGFATIGMAVFLVR